MRLYNWNKNNSSRDKSCTLETACENANICGSIVLQWQICTYYSGITKILKIGPWKWRSMILTIWLTSDCLTSVGALQMYTKYDDFKFIHFGVIAIGVKLIKFNFEIVGKSCWHFRSSWIIDDLLYAGTICTHLVSQCTLLTSNSIKILHFSVLVQEQKKWNYKRLNLKWRFRTFMILPKFNSLSHIV